MVIQLLIVHAYSSLLRASPCEMSSESALPIAIPNVAQGVEVSTCSLCCLCFNKEEEALAHLWWYPHEVIGFDFFFLFPFFFPLKDGVPSDWPVLVWSPLLLNKALKLL